MAARGRAAGLRGAGWQAVEIREGGCQAAETREAGCRAVEMREAGCRAVEMREARCRAETREAGWQAVEIRLSQVVGSLQPAATPQRKPVNFDVTRNDKLWPPGCTLQIALLPDGLHFLCILCHLCAHLQPGRQRSFQQPRQQLRHVWRHAYGVVRCGQS